MVTVAEKGFKRTEVGMIPDDWDSTKSLNNLLSEMTDFVAAGSFESLRENVSVYDFDNYAFYIRLVDIRAGIGHLNQKYVDKKSYDFLRRSNLFGGEILIANIGANVGEVFLMPNVKKPSTIAPNMILMRTNESIINSSFCYYFINSKTGQKLLSELISGSGHPKLNKTDLKKLLIPLPPTLEEQKSIATALTDLDELITGLEKLISKKKNIKQGAMQQLLTPPHKGGKRLPGFSGDWIKESIKSIVSTPVTDGPHETPKFVREGVPFLSVNNIVNNRIDYSDLRYITKIDDEIYSKKCKPIKNDILLGKAASVGKVAVVDKDWDFNIWSPLALIRCKNNYSPYFVFYSFQTKEMYRQIDGLTNSSSQGNIGMGDIEKLEIFSPKYFNEQQAIAKVLLDMDDEITQLETKKEKYQAIKQGMMQELLTGKTRLV